MLAGERKYVYLCIEPITIFFTLRFFTCRNFKKGCDRRGYHPFLFFTAPSFSVITVSIQLLPGNRHRLWTPASRKGYAGDFAGRGFFRNFAETLRNPDFRSFKYLTNN